MFTQYTVRDNGRKIEILGLGAKPSENRVLAAIEFAPAPKGANRADDVRADWRKTAVQGLKDRGILAEDAERIEIEA